jgi:integrase
VDSGYVFTRDDGNLFRVNTVTEQFSEFLKKNQLPKIRFHDLRHTLPVFYILGESIKNLYPKFWDILI